MASECRPGSPSSKGNVTGGASGIGRDGGDWSFDFYMETKNIAIALDTDPLSLLLPEVLAANDVTVLVTGETDSTVLELPAAILGGLIVAHQHLEHDHARPPVVVARTELAIGQRAVERPVHILLPLDDEPLIVQEMTQWHEAITVVRRTFPVIAVATQPATVESDVGPELIEMACKPVGLHT